MNYFKTNIRDEVTTLIQAKKWLAELVINGECWHPDDEALQIVWENSKRKSDVIEIQCRMDECILQFAEAEEGITDQPRRP